MVFNLFLFSKENSKGKEGLLAKLSKRDNAKCFPSADKNKLIYFWPIRAIVNPGLNLSKACKKHHARANASTKQRFFASDWLRKANSTFALNGQQIITK